MLATAWFCIRLLGLVSCIGAIWLGLSLRDDDDQLAPVPQRSSGTRLGFGPRGLRADQPRGHEADDSRQR